MTGEAQSDFLSWLIQPPNVIACTVCFSHKSSWSVSPFLPAYMHWDGTYLQRRPSELESYWTWKKVLNHTNIIMIGPSLYHVPWIKITTTALPETCWFDENVPFSLVLALQIYPGLIDSYVENSRRWMRWSCLTRSKHLERMPGIASLFPETQLLHLQQPQRHERKKKNQNTVWQIVPEFAELELG